jgi:hypothetical protein
VNSEVDVRWWRDWIRAHKHELVGGDVEESRNRMHLRGPILDVELKGTNLVFKIEWTATFDSNRWRIFRGRRNTNEISFDLRGLGGHGEEKPGVYVLRSALITLEIYALSSGNKLDRSQVREV